MTLALGALGAAAAVVAGVPAPYLTGPALAVSAASLLGVPTGVPRRARDACVLVIGLGMGAGITPEAMATVAAWPASFAALAAALALTVAAGARLLTRRFGYDRDTAVLAALPGHLSYVLALGERLAGPSVAVMSVIQALRVLALTLLVPLALTLTTEGDLARAPDLGADMAPGTLLALAAVCALAGWLGERWGVPAAFLLAGMTISGALHLGGWVRGDVPAAVGVPAFVAMGALIGSRFSGVTPALLARAAAAGAAMIAVSGGIAAAAALAVSVSLGLPIAQTLIAFAPGGLETMAALAVLMGADPAYVAAHHAGRLLLLTVAVPVIMRRR